ncbi:MAG: OmpA family protein [Bacteroidales bacterium]|nr:OmpA family protein [Bacteroidales bacterium]
MFRKLLLVAAAALTVSAAAFAQAESAPLSKTEKFYQVVPKHEFTINGFGGMSTLMYKVNGSYYVDYNQQQQQVLSQTPAVKSDLVNFSNGPFHPTGLGGGGGFGYIWHFHPNVGLMTGVDVAYYSGGIRGLGAIKEDELWYPLASSYIVTGYDGTKYLMGYGVSDYSEMQKYLALQIPVMFQFMAPMGQGNNHFYAAVGARIGFGVWNNYKGKGGDLFSTYAPFDEDFPYTTTTTHVYINMDGNNGYITLPMEYWSGPGDYNEHPEKYPWAVVGEATPTSDPTFSYEPEGKWGAKLVNVMVSAELGFRWNLGRSANNYGFGLYTALYADYGILTVNKKENVAMMTGYDIYGREGSTYGPYEPHSVLNAQNAPYASYERDRTPGNVAVYYQYDETVKPLAKAHTLAAGLKLKFAFGKVSAIAPVVPILPKPDTVTKIVYVRDTVQNTVVVRDTVQNTVVVRDTVTNTVVVRDTITIIKEVPVEIQQTMRDLSNTLFEFNKFNVGPKAQGYLDEIVDWLVANPKVKVEIGGHTDGVGSQEYNQKLSEQRAKTVYNYFVEHGVNKDRLSYKGYGKLEPIADNNTDAGRQQNRRVELKIIQ